MHGSSQKFPKLGLVRSSQKTTALSRARCPCPHLQNRRNRICHSRKTCVSYREKDFTNEQDASTLASSHNRRSNQSHFGQYRTQTCAQIQPLLSIESLSRKCLPCYKTIGQTRHTETSTAFYVERFCRTA